MDEIGKFLTFTFGDGIWGIKPNDGDFAVVGKDFPQLMFYFAIEIAGKRVMIFPGREVLDIA